MPKKALIVFYQVIFRIITYTAKSKCGIFYSIATIMTCTICWFTIGKQTSTTNNFGQIKYGRLFSRNGVKTFYKNNKLKIVAIIAIFAPDRSSICASHEQSCISNKKICSWETRPKSLSKFIENDTQILSYAMTK